MSHAFYPSGNPRFNHVAMSVPSETLLEPTRRELNRFFADVLGFDELTTMTEDGRRLIYSCVHWQQFIFLIADDDPMRCPRMDHYGFSVGSLDELLAARDRAQAFQQQDARLELVDHIVDDQGMVKIHSIYIGYLLPMLCELQFWELLPGRVRP